MHSQILVRLTRVALKHGCAGVLMLPPFYYKEISDEGLFCSYAEVIECVGDDRLRIYLYHIPPLSGVPIKPQLVERLLSKYPGMIAGIKDSSGDWRNTKAMLDNFVAAGLDVFVGSETFLLENLRNGGAGCISATANVNPAAIVRLCENWQGQDAERMQSRLNSIRNLFQQFPMIAAVKATAAHFRGDPEWIRVRPPLVELDQEQRSVLLKKLAEQGFSMIGLDD